MQVEEIIGPSNMCIPVFSDHYKCFIILVKLFCCLPDEYAEHRFNLSFFLMQKSGARLLSPALSFASFPSYFSTVTVWSSPSSQPIVRFSEARLLLKTVLCAFERTFRCIRNWRWEYLVRSCRGHRWLSWSLSLCNKGNTAHQANSSAIMERISTLEAVIIHGYGQCVVF